MPLDPEDRAELEEIVAGAVKAALATPVPDSPAELEAAADALTDNAVDDIQQQVVDDAGENDGGPAELGGPPDDDGLTAAVDDAGLGVVDDVPDVAGVVPIVEDTQPVREHPYWRKLRIGAKR